MKIEMKSLRIILIIVSISFGPFCGCEKDEDSYNPYHRLRTLTSQEWSKNIKRTYSPHPDENGKVRLDLGNTYITISLISYTYSYNTYNFPIERITIYSDPSVANVTHTFIYHE